MPSPAQSHYQKRMAERAAQSSNNAPATNDTHSLLLIALGNDLNTLRNIRAMDGKIKAKADMIGRYAAWVRGAIDAGKDGNAIQDDIIGYVMIWALDLEQWDYALEIAMHMFKHDLSLPERFNNNVATLLVDEVADSQLKRQIDVPKPIIQKVVEMTMDEDITDQANAKLHRVLGDKLADDYENYDEDNPPTGGRHGMLKTILKCYNNALKLNAKVGVKTEIKRFEKMLKDLPTE